MKLSEEQSEKLLEKLRSYGNPAPCPICGSTSLSVNDTIFELREFQKGNMIIGGNQSVFPVIPMSCGNCGHTSFLNAIIAKVIDPNQETK